MKRFSAFDHIVLPYGFSLATKVTTRALANVARNASYATTVIQQLMENLQNRRKYQKLIKKAYI